MTRLMHSQVWLFEDAIKNLFDEKRMNFVSLRVPRRIRLRVILMCSVRLRTAMHVAIYAMCVPYTLRDCTPWSRTTRSAAASQNGGGPAAHKRLCENSLALENRRHLFKRCHTWKCNESTCRRSQLKASLCLEDVMIFQRAFLRERWNIVWDKDAD